MSFDGNPLNYFLFMKTFENRVEKSNEDDILRLQLLIQYCTGKATETIKRECPLKPSHIDFIFFPEIPLGKPRNVV